jgi:small GTP-binding protein
MAQAQHSPASPPDASGYDELRCKVVAIGDGSIGKTCMLYSYANHGSYLADVQKYVPTVFENYQTTVPITNNATNEVEDVKLSIWDTAGQDEFKTLRRMCYNAEIVSTFLLCFAIDNPTSFANVELSWYHEVKSYEMDVKKALGLPLSAPRPFSVILVGTKCDSRGQAPGTPSSSAGAGGTGSGSPNSKQQGLVKKSDAETLRDQMQAEEYIECSAKTNDNIKSVIDAAVKHWYVRHSSRMRKIRPKKDAEGCTML